MPRASSGKKIEAERLFKKGMKLKDIAKELDVPEGTVRSWKNRGNWEVKTLNKNQSSVANGGAKNGATLQKRKRGGQHGNKNAIGHASSVPKKNKNAEKHGFFAKYLPEDALSIIDDINEKEYLDILWENIQISYAAILRAQKIMFVSGKDEMVKEIKRIKEKGGGLASEREIEWELQFAWDRQASFLAAQARAMAELRSLIRQYEEMASEGQKARVEKIKAETDRIRGASGSGGDGEIDDWVASVESGMYKNEAGGLL